MKCETRVLEYQRENIGFPLVTPTKILPFLNLILALFTLLPHRTVNWNDNGATTAESFLNPRGGLDEHKVRTCECKRSAR